MNNIKQFTLDNGLSVYFYQDKRKHNVYVNLTTKLGGIHQEYIMDNKKHKICDGMAHLIEHYVCECSQEGDIVKRLGQKHMLSNATTSMLKTSYYFSTTKDLEYGLKTLIKGCYCPIFSEENLEKVKAPIYQELKMHEDGLFYEFNHTVYDCVFKNIKFKDVGGNKDEVNNITLEEVKNCYEAFYQPNNQCLFVAGNFPLKKTLNFIKKLYKDINFPKHKVTYPKINEPKKVVKKKQIINSKAAQDYVEIAYKIDLHKFKKMELLKLDFYFSTFLRLYCGITSQLYNDMVKKKVINTSINYDNYKIFDYGLLSIGSYTDKPNVLVKNINEALNNFQDKKEEFELYKKSLIAEIAVRPERIGSVIGPFIENVIAFDFPYQDSIELIQSLNYQEFKKYIKRLDFTNYAVVIMKKQD